MATSANDAQKILKTAAQESAKSANLIFQILKARGETLALAESCTGGLVSAELARIPGISAVFLGSFITYSNTMKEEYLEVPQTILKSIGAVSLPVARLMAQGARKNAHADWAISITGIAGPDGGSVQKPVGTVCFGVCGPGVVSTEQRHFQGQRLEVQVASMQFALDYLLANLGYK